MDTTQVTNTAIESLESVDAALRAETELQAKQRSQESRAEASRQRRASSIGTALRFLGVTALLTAAGIFLFQRWDGATHLSRYGMFLAFTTLVTLAGVFCSRQLHEQKGARTFLGVVLMFLPVHFAQLGAILFSRFGRVPEDAAGYYPFYLYWEAPSVESACIATAVGLLALLPMSYLAFSALARRHARDILATSFVAGAMLLVPTRDPSSVALIAILTWLFAIARDMHFSGCPEMRTLEGQVARLVPFAMAATAVGRQCALYETNQILAGAFLVGGSIIALRARPTAHPRGGTTAFCEVLAWVLAVPGMLLINWQVAETFAFLEPIHPLVVGVPLAIVMIHFDRRATLCNLLFKVTAVITVGLSLLTQYSNTDSFLICLFGLVLGVIGVVIASARESKMLFWSGVAVASTSLMRLACISIEQELFNSWIVLGTLGVVAVMAGSYLESNFHRLAERLRAHRTTMSRWT